MVYLAAILTISSLFDASEWACPYGWESTWQHLYMAQPVGRITNQMTYANELLHPPALGRVWRLGTVDIPPCFLLPPPLELTLAATAGPSYVGTMRDFGKGETHDDHSRPRRSGRSRQPWRLLVGSAVQHTASEIRAFTLFR